MNMVNHVMETARSSCRFHEWNMPNAGIDTIAIWIHPSLVNRHADFHKYGNNNKSINCRFKREMFKGKIMRTNCIIDIQAEAINPDFDILSQIIHILAQFVYCGTLKLPDNANTQDVPGFFFENFPYLFSVNKLDFYFDFRHGDCEVKDNGDMEFSSTAYSKDYPSSLKSYNRIDRLIKKNNLPHDTIRQMEFPMRVEFHLERGNCGYLAYQNLQGTFDAVFLAFLPLLARKWFDHNRQVVNIPNIRNLPYAHHYRQIVCMALAGRIPQYKSLQRTPPRPDNLQWEW